MIYALFIVKLHKYSVYLYLYTKFIRIFALKMVCHTKSWQI